MASDALDEKTGFLSGHAARYVLIDEDGLPWLLDGSVRFGRFKGGFVTVRGIAYAECRFTVIEIADAV